MYAYLVDDDPLVLASLAATLGGRFEVQTFPAAEDFLGALDHLAPGVILVDLAMPGMDGSTLHSELLARDAPMTVVFLTGAGGVTEAVDAMRRGAVDFLCKPIRRAELLASMERAVDRQTRLMATRRRRTDVARLTERERQVLQGLAAGAPSKIIAHHLGISSRTVEMHRARICDKLRAPTMGAIAIACEAGLIDVSAAYPT
jgi:FixJ family two-component response regulator